MMQKTLILSCTLAAMALGTSAQDLRGTRLEDRIGHGQDSIDVRQGLSLYQSYFKQGDYLEAIEPWEVAFTKGPLSQSRVYTDGAWMFENLIKAETDEAKKNEYFDKLMKIYDQRLQYLDALNSFA